MFSLGKDVEKSSNHDRMSSDRCPVAGMFGAALRRDEIIWMRCATHPEAPGAGIRGVSSQMAPKPRNDSRVSILSIVRRLTSPVGEIEVTEVDEVSAVAKIISGDGFKVGDMVKSKK